MEKRTREEEQNFKWQNVQHQYYATITGISFDSKFPLEFLKET